MIEYNIKVSDNSAIKTLERLSKDSPEIEKKALNRIGQGCMSWIQKNKLRGQVLRRQSGNLANSMQYRIKGAHTVAVGPGMEYGAAHEFGIALSAGKYIYPKRGKALKFKVNGDTIFATKVRQHVVKRPFVAPGIKEYFNSGRAKIDIDRLLQREIDSRSR